MDLKGLSGILYSIHQMLAGITKTAELELEEKEAEKLADAAANVAQHYDITASEKTLAWTNLAFCMGTIYGTRFVAISLRKKEQKAAAKKTNGATSPNGHMDIDSHTFMTAAGIGMA